MDARQAAPAFNLRPPRPGWGISLPGLKQPSTRGPIQVLPPPDEVVIALSHARGCATPVVHPGDQVLTGQLLAQDEMASAHASVTGIVTAIEPRAVPGSPATPCVVIRRQGTERLHPACTPLDPMALPPVGIIRHIRDGGIVGLGGASFPTARKLAARTPVRALIINGVECEPWISCDEMLLRERAATVVRGTAIMMRALAAERAVIAIKVNMTEARIALHDALESSGAGDISLALVTARYPSGGERQLIQLLTGAEVPAGGLPCDIGYLCQNAGTAAAVADLFDRGQPLVSRVVTVTGAAIRQPGNFEVRIGTPLSALLAAAGGCHETPQRLIMGGPMMGITVDADALPATRGTNCLVAAGAGDLAPQQVEMPCIRCGFCVEVCPARLMPHELLGAVRSEDGIALDALGLAACIECGSCDLVCPSSIALTPRFAAARAIRIMPDEAGDEAP
ncbi:MAG: electron transport complex subunit RsxC [Gammaproteobacteria bacterium]|nr:electron transport complex subunit RsxC [Gammaproteobacteria bacterium]